MLTTLGTTTDSVQGDDNRRKKQRKVRLQESSAFTPSSMVFPCRPPRVPAASSVLFFTVKHPGRPSPGIPVCNFPLCLKSDVWIIYLSMMSLMSRFCITGLFFGYFEFILACFFGSDWYIFSITQFRAHQGQRYNSVNPHRKGWLWLLTFNWLSWFHPSLKRFDPHRSLDSSSYDILFVSVEFHFIMTSGVFLPPLSSPPPSWLILHQLTYRISGSSSWMAMQFVPVEVCKK